MEKFKRLFIQKKYEIREWFPISDLDREICMEWVEEILENYW